MVSGVECVSGLMAKGLSVSGGMRVLGPLDKEIDQQ